jgi:hypothetical protein
VIRLSPSILVCSLAALASCTESGSTPLFEHPVPAPFTLTGQDPAPDETDVPVDQPIAFTFSDVPDPDSLSRLSFALTSGSLLFTGGFRVDLIERRVRYVPARDLPPHLLMRVHVGAGITSLDGRPLAAPADWSFTTGTTDGGAPPPVPELHADDVAPLFVTRCAGSCHAGPGATLGVNLETAQAAYDTLVGRSARERPPLYRVAAGDSSRSYLLRKLLGAQTMVGDTMPPPPAEPLTAAELRQIADWIDGGARR